MELLGPNASPLINESKRDFMKKTATLSAAAALMSLVPPGVRSAALTAGDRGRVVAAVIVAAP